MKGGHGLSPQEINLLFGANAYNGNDYPTLAKVIEVGLSQLKAVENISLIPAYESLPNYYLKEYLKHEQGFYLSQGCKYSCTFCSAKRTGHNAYLNKKEKLKESYRDIKLAAYDLEYLISKSLEFGFNSLQIYFPTMAI